MDLLVQPSPPALETPHPTTRDMTRSRRTQAERAALSEDRLLDAALRLISERGWAGTSLQAIGDAAGYSRGLVSHRFGSKEGLLWALLERIFAHWDSSRLSPAVEGRVGVEALHAAIEATRQAMHAAPERLRAFYALLFESLGPLGALRPKVAEFHRRQRAAVAGWIEAGIRAGNVPPEVDAATQAALFMSALRGASYQWLIDPENVDIDAIYDEIKKTFTRTLGGS